MSFETTMKYAVYEKDGQTVWACEGTPEGRWQNVRNPKYLKDPVTHAVPQGGQLVYPNAPIGMEYYGVVGQEMEQKINLYGAIIPARKLLPGEIPEDGVRPENTKLEGHTLVYGVKGLPEGITIDDDGNFRGIPTEVGTYRFSGMVRNPEGKNEFSGVLRIQVRV